ncbi:hypothetical protein [Spirosoma migulaei]
MIVSDAFIDLLNAQPLRRPGDYFPIIQIHDDGQIEPAFTSGNVLEIINPCLPGFIGLNWRFKWFSATG